jgi:hypothetical protein
VAVWCELHKVERRPQDSKLNFPRAEYDGESEELRRISHQEMADKLRWDLAYILLATSWMSSNRLISVYRLGEMPIQSCGQSVIAPRGKAGARLNAHTELRSKRQRLAWGAIYPNRPIPETRVHMRVDDVAVDRPDSYCWPFHVMPSGSGTDGLNCVSMTWRGTFVCP